jgi:RNA polymerase sigma-70 factor (ECF subfamily)
MSETSIARWIERWLAGDELAAKALYEHFRAPTYRLAYSLLGNAEDAEEAAQDALTYALTHIHRFDPTRASFATWLHTITVSRSRDRHRRRGAPLVSLTQWLKRGRAPRSHHAGPERQAVETETRGEVWDAVQALSPSLREAVLLRYWAGHTYKEIAAIMDCPLRTAQSRVRLAYEQLRSRLTPAAVQQLKEEGR